MLDLLPWDITGFDRPSSTDKAEDLAKAGVYRKPEPTMRIFFSDERAELIAFDKGADFGLWWACSDWVAWTNQRETVL